MIIECKSCLKKFKVNDSDILEMGRVVQCGNCSSQWLQMPVSAFTEDTEKIIKDDDKVETTNSSLSEMIASDGKSYKFLGSQWAEVLPSGKTGRLAKKKIAKELDKFAGTKKEKIVKKKTRNEVDDDNNGLDKSRGQGMGIFSMLLVFFLFVAAMILLLDTFKFLLIPIWHELENYLVHVFETLNNIYILIQDFVISYK